MKEGRNTLRYRERYKHLLNGLACLFLWMMQMAAFAYTWYQIYVPNMAIEDRFWARGNWAVIGMYGLYLFFFTKVLGGYRIGYCRIGETILSQYIGIICANIIEYFQLCMIHNDYVPVQPLSILMMLELLFVILVMKSWQII